jgi:hypothetical protein
MKSVRLTKDLRSRILASYIKCYDASNPTPKKLDENEIESVFAEQIRVRLFKKAGVDETAIPSEFLSKNDRVVVCLPDSTVRHLRLRGSDGWLENRNMPRQEGAFPISDSDADYIAYKEAKRNLKEFNKGYENWNSQRDSVIEQVRMALDAVNTTGQLLTAWPEAEKFIPNDVLDFSTISLPSVSFNSLNKAAGI